MSFDEKISARIELLRFPLIVGVVFIHVYWSTIGASKACIGNSTWVEFIGSFISCGLATVAVPLFFLISGYLFFQGEWSWRRYIGKLERRVHTLLIPFLFWNLATVLVFRVLWSIPQTRVYISRVVWPSIHSFSSFVSYIGFLFGITSAYPISLQMWFLRNLIALAILSPLIHFLLVRKSALPFLVALYVLWYIVGRSDFTANTYASFFFFSLGAYLSIWNIYMCLDRVGLWISAIFVGLLVLQSALQEQHMYLHNAVIAFGVPSIWWLTKLLTRTYAVKSVLIKLSGASFFVFAAHQLLIMTFNKVLWKLVAPANGMAILGLYILIGICAVTLPVIVYWCKLNTMPSFLGFITGSHDRTYRSTLKSASVQ
jgi:surface polysaccharide O-acyltransferase-like enzyme